MYKQLYFDKAPELVKTDNTGKQYIDIECHYSRKDCYGIGRLYDNNTVLLTEGIYDKCRPSSNNMFRQRYRLKLGLSVNEGELQRNILCDSPSMAACVITGNSSNGWSEWKDNKGREIIFYTDDSEDTEQENNNNTYKVNSQVYQYAQEIIMKEELEKYIASENEYGKPTNIDFFLRSELATEIIKTPTVLKSNGLEKYINKQWLSIVQRSDDISDLCFDGGYDFYNYLSKQDIKTKDDLRNAIEQYKVPSIPVLSTALHSIFQRYSGSEIYKVPQADGTFKYLITTAGFRIVIFDEFGNKISETIDNDMIDSLNKMTFKQVYLGTDINIFLNTSTNNISDVELYLKCKNIEELKTISNQHNIIDNVAHANMADTSMVSGDSLESDKAEQAERSYDSHNASTANIADDLTDNAIEKVVESFTDSIVNGDKKEILDAIEQKIFEKQQERREKEMWSYPVSVYTHEFESLDIYRNETLENADRHLTNSHRLLIIGSTGDGKTELAYYIAHKLTGENIGANRDSSYFNRICIGSARDARPIYTEKDSEYIGKLNRFIKHIKDNGITEPCVFICNEIQASDMGYILGENLWEEFNNSGISEILPDNLYLIFTGCKDRDFGIDSQILQRIPSVEIGCISSNFEDKHEKMLKAFDGVNDNLINILKLVEDINDSEGYPIISMRKFKDILTGKPFDLGINDESILSSETIRTLDKLREQYGN